MSTQLENTNSLKSQVINLFNSDKLNDLGAKIIDLDNQYQKCLIRAEDNLFEAFKTRWEYGRLISENIEHIKEVCGSQKAFAQTIRKSEATISNNKRGYESLLARGCETWENVVQLLRSNNIKPTSQNFEKIDSLLNAPKQDVNQVDQIDKDEKELIDIYNRIEDLKLRLEPGSKPEIYEEIFKLEEDLSYVDRLLKSFDPSHTQWESEAYLNHVRSFGRDLITMNPCERCDPHHTTPTGGSGSQGAKLADFFCIPVDRITHMAIESGLLTPTPEQILRAQFITLSSFLYLNMTRSKK